MENAYLCSQNFWVKLKTKSQWNKKIYIKNQKKKIAPTRAAIATATNLLAKTENAAATTKLPTPHLRLPNNRQK
jgi:hypothetical protein